MSLLSLVDGKKHYAAQEVLSGASFKLDPGEKIGIVGRNGGGKSTLFRLIEGLDQPDWGRIVVRRDTDLGFVAQRPSFEPGVTVRTFVEAGMQHAQQALQRLEAVALAMAEAQGKTLDTLMEEHGNLSARVEALGGWDIERRIERVLGGIGLDEGLWDREARTLSGGEKGRTAMARALAGGHDLLLLDEPTNHLDLPGIEWLEEYIREERCAVLVISHDRRLLENAVDSVLELERGKLVRYSGNYTKYIQLKEERYESEERAWKNQQEFLRKEESFIKKHMGSQRTAEAKGRLKKLRNIERIERPFHDVRRPIIRAPRAKRGGEKVLEAEDISMSFGERTIWSGVNLRIGRGDRIGLVGRNGAGKTSLLRILAGLTKPTSGAVLRGHGAECGYYDQETGDFLDDGTPLSEVRRRYPALTDGQIRSHLALFLFRGESETDKPVPALSGGERARLALALLVMEKPSWLAMDEPTNHLDLAGRTALEEMLAEFQGALVLISHDRQLLDDLCTKIIEVDAGGLREFVGNYTHWRAVKAAETAEAQTRANKKTADRKAEAKKKAGAAAAPKPQGQGQGKGQGSGQVRNPYKFKQLEERIMKLEERLERLNRDLTREEVYRDAAKAREVQFEIAEIEAELEDANETWSNWG